MPPWAARPVVTFEVAANTFPTASGRATAVAVGELGPGGALVVETRHGAVYPQWVPEAPDDDAPDWTEVDL